MVLIIDNSPSIRDNLHSLPLEKEDVCVKTNRPQFILIKWLQESIKYD